MGDVKGISQVIVNLSRWGDNVLKEIVNGAEAVQAKVINDAQAIVPVDTGNLQGSIREGGIIIEDDNVRAIVVANAEYASYVEFGTVKMRAQPYMVPSLLGNMDTFRNAMTAALKRAEAK